GGITVGETVSLAGVGVGFGLGDASTNTSIVGTNSFPGALRSTSGSNTLTGTVILNANSTIGVDAGSTLNISGQVTSVQTAGFGLTKVGGGTLQLSNTGTGNNANNYTGTTTVEEGLLQLNTTAVSFAGALTIGDNAGVAASDSAGTNNFNTPSTSWHSFGG